MVLIKNHDHKTKLVKAVALSLGLVGPFQGPKVTYSICDLQNRTQTVHSYRLVPYIHIVLRSISGIHHVSRLVA